MKKTRGFTLIELLIVVAIIGVIAAIAIPNLLAALQRARQKRTMADIRQIALAWESMAVEAGDYSPAGISICCTVGVSIADAVSSLQPTYINPLPQRDGWKNPYLFSTNSLGSEYMIMSYGSNMTEDGTLAGGATRDFDCDIVYSNGTFLQYPEGAQTQ